MWNKTKTDVREIITKIEVASDRIVMEASGRNDKIKITDVFIDALRLLKDNIAIIRSATDDTLLKHSEILERILGYVNNAVAYPNSIELWVERVKDHVRDYIMENKSFDAKAEADKDTAIRGRVDIKRANDDIDRINRRMEAIKEDWITNGYSVNSPRYITQVSEYNTLEKDLESKKYELSTLQRMNMANSNIRSQVERRQATENAMAGITMTSEEYTALVMENREWESELSAELEVFERVGEEAWATSIAPKIDDTKFRRAIEETLLERLYKSNAEEYDSRVAVMPKDTLLDAMLQVIRKIDDVESLIESSVGDQKKQAEETRMLLDEMLANTSYIAAMREDMSGDITKEVGYCLSRKPADIQSAHLKIRNCIELFCRFRKGVDLNEKLFFHQGETGEAKIASVNKTEHDAEIANYYTNSNGFIHSENGFILMTDEERAREAESLREIAKNLHDWKIDEYDFSEGMKLHYVTRDQMLKQMIDEGRIDRNFVDAESKYRGKIYYYFVNLNSSYKLMKEQGIDVPWINFIRSDDVKRYLDERDSVCEKSAEPKSQEVKAEEIKPLAIENRRDNRLESEIIKYFPDAKYGFIRNPDKPDDPKGIYFRNLGDDTGFVRGARVSYVMGRNEMGPCAKNVTPVASAEVTD